MIDPDWLLEDLDPRTWRAIGQFFLPVQYIAAAQPVEHGLFVLHVGGLGPRIVDTSQGVRTDLGVVSVDDSRALARELHARGEWDRVHVIDKLHLQRVARSVSTALPRETVDAHYHRVFQALWDGSDGYVAVPPHAGQWHGWSYSTVLSSVAKLPSPSALGLVVLSDDRTEVQIGLAAHVVDARVRRVTTLEGLPALPPASVDQGFLAAFCSALASRLAAPAAALVCTRSAFDAWLYADVSKVTVLQQAVARGEAILHNAL